MSLEQRKEQIRAELLKQSSATVPEEEKKVIMTKIEFLHATPSFVWKDMKVYGPFEEGEETEIFPEVAKLLIQKGRAKGS